MVAPGVRALDFASPAVNSQPIFMKKTIDKNNRQFPVAHQSEKMVAPGVRALDFASPAVNSQPIFMKFYTHHFQFMLWLPWKIGEVLKYFSKLNKTFRVVTTSMKIVCVKFHEDWLGIDWEIGKIHSPRLIMWSLRLILREEDCEVQPLKIKNLTSLYRLAMYKV